MDFLEAFAVLTGFFLIAFAVWPFMEAFIPAAGDNAVWLWLVPIVMSGALVWKGR